MQDQLIQKLKVLVDDIVSEGPLYLVDIELKGSSRNTIVWVYIESEAGNISLDQCTQVNRQLGFLIDANEVFPDKYTLNVSSPGLDRPLTDIRQYINNKGRQISVKYRFNDEQKTLAGELADVESDNILIKAQDGRHEVRFEDIIETKIKAVI